MKYVVIYLKVFFKNVWRIEISAYICITIKADMAKLVDVPDLGSGAARRVGSSPIIRTKGFSIEKPFFMPFIYLLFNLYIKNY